MDNKTYVLLVVVFIITISVDVFNRQRGQEKLEFDAKGTESSMQGVQDGPENTVPDPLHLEHFASVNTDH